MPAPSTTDRDDIKTQLTAQGIDADLVDSICIAIDDAGFDITRKSDASTVNIVGTITPERWLIAGLPGVSMVVIDVDGAGNKARFIEEQLSEPGIRKLYPVGMAAST